MTANRLLIIDDDTRLTEMLTEYLASEGIELTAASSGTLGLRDAQRNEYDLIILDVMLPDQDGWSVLAGLRASDKQAPVLFLTARDAVEDRVRGLQGGADDYLVKPFAFVELLARVRTLLRRRPLRQPETLRIADLEINLLAHRAVRAGERLDLTPKEFSLLSLLARRSGEVVTRTIISSQVWDMNFDGHTNVVDVHIRRLRAKIDDPFEEKLIHTVRGLGYVLEARSWSEAAVR